MLVSAFLYGFIFSKKLVSFKCKIVTVLFFTCHHGIFSLLTPTGPLYGGRIFNIAKKGWKASQDLPINLVSCVHF